MAPFESLGTVSYLPSIVTMTILYCFGDKARYWLKTRFFHTPCIQRPRKGEGSRRGITELVDLID